jgi:hypothetical protein
VDADLDRFLADLRREQRAQGGAEGAEIVMLNGRGYNYGPPPRIDLDLERARAAEAPPR